MCGRRHEDRKRALAQHRPVRPMLLGSLFVGILPSTTYLPVLVPFPPPSSTLLVLLSTYQYSYHSHLLVVLCQYYIPTSTHTIPTPGLCAAGGMGLWHGVEYYEEERIRTEPFKGSWDDVSNSFYIYYKYTDCEQSWAKIADISPLKSRGKSL